MEGVVAIILAAGSGERLGGASPKAFLELAGRPMIAIAAAAAAGCPAVASLIIVAPEGLEPRARAVVDVARAVTVVTGGTTRHASVLAGLAAVPDVVPVVVCHDAARPFASSELFAAVLEALNDAEGAIPMVPVPDTVKRVRDGLVVSTELRQELALAQTPQAFAAQALRDAHARAAAADLEFTDDAAVMEWAGYRVRAVPGEPENFKVTSLTDLARAEFLAAEARRG